MTTCTTATLTRKERLCAYVQKWQHVLRLKDWRITVTEQEPSRNDNASVWMRSASKRAQIAVDSRCPELFEESEVVHEMLEIICDRWDDLTKELIELHAPEALRAKYKDRLDHDRHEVIFQLVSAFVPVDNDMPFDLINERRDP